MVERELCRLGLRHLDINGDREKHSSDILHSHSAVLQNRLTLLGGHYDLSVLDYFAHRRDKRAVCERDISVDLLVFLVLKLVVAVLRVLAVAEFLSLAALLADISLSGVVVLDVKEFGVSRPNELTDLVLVVFVVADIERCGLIVGVVFRLSLFSLLRSDIVLSDDVLLRGLELDEAVLHVIDVVNVRLPCESRGTQTGDLDISDRVVRDNGLIPLYEPHRAAIDGVEALVHVVVLLEGEFVSLVPQKSLDTLCVALVALAPHLSGDGRVRNVACDLRLHKLVGDVTNLLCLLLRAVYLVASFVLCQISLHLGVDVFRRGASFSVQFLKEDELRAVLIVDFHSSGSPYLLIIT